MPNAATALIRPIRRWMACLSIAFPLMALLFLGQDHNWDLQNYHLYNPFAWLHGRLRLDIAPAQLQTWHNPLLDVPMYLMAVAHLPGALICVWLALPSMLALYLLLRMYALLSVHPLNRVRVATLAVFTMGGGGFFAVIGTCLNDAFVAAGVMGSLYLLLREDPDADHYWIWCVAGALAGATTGLKLTAAVYCLGLAGAALAWPSWRRLPYRLGALLAGGVIGFALTYGYWGTLLFHLHGNPFFPYYNQVFHSPDAAFAPNTDDRFRPAGLVDALLAPLHLLQKSQRFSEMNLRDPRLLLGVLSYASLVWKARRGPKHRDPLYVGRLQGLAGFFLVALLAWSTQYGIYRYAIPLEMLGCLGFVLILEWLPQSRLESGSIIGCMLAIAATYPATWGRSHFEASYVDVRMPQLPHNSMIVLSSQSPLAFAVTALPDDVAAIAIDNTLMHPDLCTALTIAARTRIAAHVGPLWLLRGGEPTDDDGQINAQKSYGLTVSAACESVATNFGPLRLCPLRRDLHQATDCAPPASAPGR
jgi:hypothetical protein